MKMSLSVEAISDGVVYLEKPRDLKCEEEYLGINEKDIRLSVPVREGDILDVDIIQKDSKLNVVVLANNQVARHNRAMYRDIVKKLREKMERR